MPIKQSVVVPMFKPENMPLGDFMREVKKIGFPAVELWSRDAHFGDFAEAALSNGLQIVSMVGHEHDSPKAGSHAEGFSRASNHDRLEAELCESILLAAKFKIPGLITLSGHRNPGESDLETLRVCAQGLRRIAPYAEEKGVNLNMELLNTTVDHPHYICDHTDWAVALCEAVNSPRVKILYDIYHMQIMEGDVIRNIRKAIKWIGHFHTAGNPGRHDLDDQQEINYRGICNAIAATDYDLYIGHEFRPKKDSFQALREAFGICQVG
ncbi:MAG: TIM barrel protein [Methylacidiphilales bacterium]|nr:TIM barrel protein [Candidatus Methylacidiphilales bacterium]